MNQKSSLNKIKDAKFLRVCTTVLAEMQRLKIPGVAMGIFNKGREFTAGFGVTSIENPLPVTPDTLFQTGYGRDDLVRRTRRILSLKGLVFQGPEGIGDQGLPLLLTEKRRGWRSRRGWFVSHHPPPLRTVHFPY